MAAAKGHDHGLGRAHVDLASERDDGDLRRLLAETPVPGSVTLTYEREPSFFIGARAEGEAPVTVIARDGDRVVGLGTLATRPAWVNGAVERVGYLSQLRLANTHRGRFDLLAAGFARLEQIHQRDPLDVCFTTVIADNTAARGLLEASPRRLPTYTALGEMVTLACLVRGTRAIADARGPRVEQGGLRIERGCRNLLPHIAAFLQQRGGDHQLAPHWTVDMLASDAWCPGLRPEDFFVARDGARIVGCVALWDQRGFKQNVVRGYRPGLDTLRRWLDRAPTWMRLPRLPRVGEPLPGAFLSHLALLPERQDALRALLDATHAEAARRNLGWMYLGLGAGSPFLATVKRNGLTITYRSVVYQVTWKSSPAPRVLDRRPPHVEVALL